MGEDARVTRARDLGLNADGINTDPDAGQAQVQDRVNREHALGFVPSDGADLGLGEEEVSVQELAEGQKEANKAFTMPPDGEAAAGNFDPLSDDTASAESDEGEDGMPAKSDSREEWDAYAESQGVDPSEFSNKDDLIAHFSS